ncbi:LysR family transcriptional regulator [Arthrobacter sp. PAMC25564]|uniref:LysR substrate-binding domain-containing protein n=1 Tax=Arthrobacter sp. PAMC25564 TaxID=2565366 RepID=UPI0010A227B1|nr:LysR substrate-binding domain-containing protein [Arthrobacter sp. PAMC25564]QCB97973.1 LysR family transcriptional regulator [Arthrobacter sp. PAMC25564]
MNRPNFTLRQLEYFVAIAQAGTLTEAALQLHVSQPGLSQSLTDLEHALDARLTVRRKARGVTLTPAGAELLRQAREILRITEEMSQLASGRKELTGVLSLGCYVTLAPTILPGLLQGFAALHPHVNINFVEGDQDELEHKLHRGEIDLAIVYDLAVRPDMAHEVIDSMRPYILLPADHRLAGRHTISLHDLEDEPMVLPSVPPGENNTLRMFEQFGVSPDVRYRPRTMELARSLVGRGMGYALFVQHTANDRTYEGNPVVNMDIEEPVGDLNVHVSWLKHVRLNRRAQAFVDFCLERGQAPYLHPRASSQA